MLLDTVFIYLNYNYLQEGSLKCFPISCHNSNYIFMNEMRIHDLNLEIHCTLIFVKEKENNLIIMCKYKALP